MIEPAIIPKSLAHLLDSLESVAAAEWVQIDMVDGKFVPYTSWPYQSGKREFDYPSNFIPKQKLSIDLMVHDAYEAALDWLSVGAARLVVHIESIDSPVLEKFFQLQDEKKSFALGLSAHNDTSLDVFTKNASRVDFIQLMGIDEIGAQGKPFDERVLLRIKQMRAAYPNLEIAVDGHVDKETLPLLKAAGADRFAIGSSIMNSEDPAAAYTEFVALEALL